MKTPKKQNSLLEWQGKQLFLQQVSVTTTKAQLRTSTNDKNEMKNMRPKFV